MLKYYYQCLASGCHECCTNSHIHFHSHGCICRGLGDCTRQRHLDCPSWYFGHHHFAYEMSLTPSSRPVGNFSTWILLINFAEVLDSNINPRRIMWCRLEVTRKVSKYMESWVGFIRRSTGSSVRLLRGFTWNRKLIPFYGNLPVSKLYYLLVSCLTPDRGRYLIEIVHSNRAAYREV